jgi:hypothetical protein
MKKIVLFLVMTFLLNANEYSFVPYEKGSVSVNEHFSGLGIPNIGVGTRCPKEGDCWSVIENQEGKVLKSFGTKDSVSLIAKGRYTGVAYGYFSQSYTSGKKTITNFYFMDHSGKSYDSPEGSSGGFDTIVSKDRKLISVGSRGIYYGRSHVVPTDIKLTHGRITNNPSGEVSIVVITQKGEIRLSNLEKWNLCGIDLSAHGDRSGVISSYPISKDLHVTAIYKYVNSYNKGLMFSQVDFEKNSAMVGWMYNSELHNVGFDPQIYADESHIVLSGENSTERHNMKFSIDRSMDLNTIIGVVPTHTIGFEKENAFSFLGGMGYSSLGWIANSSVDKTIGEETITYSNVEYEISNSLYESKYLQGRYKDTQLAITHLKQEAEAAGGFTKKASQFLSFAVDLNGLFSPTSSLRILSEKGEVNGIAKETLKDGTLTSSVFETTNQRYAFLVMGERGMYWGVDYITYNMPTVLGVSGSSKSIIKTVFDKAFEMDKYAFVFGYDELSYAKRYETDLARFYMQAYMGLGLASLTLGDEAKKALESDGRTINSETSFIFDGMVDVGYIWQQRFRAAWGAGYSVSAGYRIKGDYFGSGQSDESDPIESDELSLEFSRYDIWHGFYINANIIF